MRYQDDFKIEWTKGQPKNMIQLGMEISRARGKLHNHRDEYAYRLGALCILDQIHKMLAANEIWDAERKLIEIKTIMEKI